MCASRTTSPRARSIPSARSCWQGLFLLTFALVETNHAAWTSPRIVTLLLAAGLLLAAFVAWERRAPLPMLPLELLRRRRFACANVVFWAAYLALAGMFFMWRVFA